MKVTRRPDRAGLVDRNVMQQRVTTENGMNVTTRAFTLPDSHLAVLEQEAAAMGMHPDKALAQAIRLYQSINYKARAGLQLAFVDAQGQLVREPAAGLPAFE